MILPRENPGEETCVCCGREIPEGRQTCAFCEAAWSRWENKKCKKTKGKKMTVRIMDFLRQWGDVGAILLCAVLLIACMCIAAASAMDGAAKEEEHPPEMAERTMEPPPKLTDAECAMIRNAAARYECGEGILDRFAEPQESTAQTEWIAVPALGWGATPLELEMVARIVWLEARGETETTQRCVAEVIFNRLRSGLWGDCLTDVLWAETENGAPEFETVDDMWTAEVDPAILEMVKSIFYAGCRIPKRILWFRADRYHSWAGAVDEFASDHTYFSSSTWVTGKQGADGTI